jgi:hypothetical protein
MFALLLGNERFGWSRPISEVVRVSPVKPSAQPTQVRTLHLPLPAKTAPGLRLSRLAGRLLVVPPCRMMCHRGVRCRSGYGHIADGNGAEPAVHGTAGLAVSGVSGCLSVVSGVPGVGCCRRSQGL